ncbi:hypothetical protein F2Q69_00013133 [Brassica cretica]|uniref:Uncharacterized protein n=1 Tax=Brassica cretica TaxID=69181 RepID=A0A8S9R140_BRACR|nr:hypothetical protein F2Q69_00013133 [Brassica cretica]
MEQSAKKQSAALQDLDSGQTSGWQRASPKPRSIVAYLREAKCDLEENNLRVYKATSGFATPSSSQKNLRVYKATSEFINRRTLGFAASSGFRHNLRVYNKDLWVPRSTSGSEAKIYGSFSVNSLNATGRSTTRLRPGLKHPIYVLSLQQPIIAYLRRAENNADDILKIQERISKNISTPQGHRKGIAPSKQEVFSKTKATPARARLLQHNQAEKDLHDGLVFDANQS